MEPSWKLRRIGIFSAMKIGAIVFLGIGFLIGTVWSIVFGFFITALASVMSTTPPSLSPAVVIALPFAAAAFYAVIGTALTFFVVLLYNIAAGIMGGVELDIAMERRDEPDSFI